MGKIQVGNVNGRLTVIGRDHNTAQGMARWLCQCSCGEVRSITTSNFRKTKSCGCSKKKVSDAENLEWMSNQPILWAEKMERNKVNFHKLLFDPGQKPFTQDWLSKTDKEGKTYYVKGLWGTPNPKNKQSNKDDCVAAYQTLWLEFDGLEKSVQKRRIDTIFKTLPPTAIVWSGSKSYHCFWRLEQGVSELEWRKMIRFLLTFVGEADFANQKPGGFMRFPDDQKQKVCFLGQRYHTERVMEWMLDRGFDPAAPLNPQQDQDVGLVESLARDFPPVNGKTKCFADSLLKKAVVKVSEAPSGERTTTLLKQSTHIGRYVGAGYLERAPVVEALTEAAIDNRIPTRDYQRAIRAGLKCGIQDPTPWFPDNFDHTEHKQLPPDDGKWT